MSQDNTRTQNNTMTQDNTRIQNSTTTLNDTLVRIHTNPADIVVIDDGENTDPETTTIITCSAVGSVVLLISIAGITLCTKKFRARSNKLQAEVDENPDYGIYSDDPDKDYIFVEDNNDYYAAD